MSEATHHARHLAEMVMGSTDEELASAITTRVRELNTLMFEAARRRVQVDVGMVTKQQVGALDHSILRVAISRRIGEV